MSDELIHFSNMKSVITGFLWLILMVVSGCSRADNEGYTAGDIRAINHVKDIGINGFSVNGYYVPGLGGVLLHSVTRKMDSRFKSSY